MALGGVRRVARLAGVAAAAVLAGAGIGGRPAPDDTPVFAAGLFTSLGGVTVPADYRKLRTAGHTRAGLGEAVYYETNSVTATAWSTQSADGRWWTLESGLPDAEQLGADAQASANQTALTACCAIGRPVQLTASYAVTGTTTYRSGTDLLGTAGAEIRTASSATFSIFKNATTAPASDAARDHDVSMRGFTINGGRAADSQPAAASGAYAIVARAVVRLTLDLTWVGLGWDGAYIGAATNSASRGCEDVSIRGAIAGCGRNAVSVIAGKRVSVNFSELLFCRLHGIDFEANNVANPQEDLSAIIARAHGNGSDLNCYTVAVGGGPRGASRVSISIGTVTGQTGGYVFHRDVIGGLAIDGQGQAWSGATGVGINHAGGLAEAVTVGAVAVASAKQALTQSAGGLTISATASFSGGNSDTPVVQIGAVTAPVLRGAITSAVRDGLWLQGPTGADVDMDITGYGRSGLVATSTTGATVAGRIGDGAANGKAAEEVGDCANAYAVETYGTGSGHSINAASTWG